METRFVLMAVSVTIRGKETFLEQCFPAVENEREKGQKKIATRQKLLCKWTLLLDEIEISFN